MANTYSAMGTWSDDGRAGMPKVVVDDNGNPLPDRTKLFQADGIETSYDNVYNNIFLRRVGEQILPHDTATGNVLKYYHRDVVAKDIGTVRKAYVIDVKADDMRELRKAPNEFIATLFDETGALRKVPVPEFGKGS